MGAHGRDRLLSQSLQSAIDRRLRVRNCSRRPDGHSVYMHDTPQRHLFEEIIYVAKGRGATSVWQEGAGKVTFEWAQGAIFAIPLNASYIHYNG